MRIILLLLAVVSWAAPVHAEWLSSSSPHFVVYANDNERNLRRFSEQLESYHSAMSFVTGAASVTPSPANRVTIYVVSTQTEVRRLMGGNNKYVAGFYRPKAGGSVAFVPRTKAGNGTQLDFSMVVLLHEYAHHFLISASAFPMPRWMSEGAAEFFASASFEKNGSVGIGRPAYHRAGELFYAKDVKAADLLDPTAYEKRKNKSYDAFYGKSWLLYHYLTFDDKRKGQLKQYAKLLTEGKSSRDAGLAAFGDFNALEHDIEAYLQKSRTSYLRLPRTLLTVGNVEIRRLRPGEVAIMPVLIRSKAGVDKTTAAQVLKDARTIAPQFSGDAAVLAALAEAEYDAGNDKEAIAAADAALAIDPKEQNAYIQKGYALFRQASDADDRAAAFKKARAPFIALNRLENDHPIPLIYFYQSFIQQGARPSPNAVEGLKRAVEVAPFDLGLHMMLATQYLRDGKPAQARVQLAPVAYNPHGRSFAAYAQAMLTRLDQNPSWDGSGMAPPPDGPDEDQGN